MSHIVVWKNYNAMHVYKLKKGVRNSKIIFFGAQEWKIN